MLESPQLLRGVSVGFASTPPAKVRFGAFELDTSAGRLSKGGIPVKLQPQPFRVLLLLTSRPGQVVTREEIRQHLWGDSTFVDFEHGINFSINQIRGVLSDDAERPRYIETLPRLGYRFIGTLDDGHGSGGKSTASASVVTTPPALTAKLWRWPRPVLYSLPLALALAGLILWVAGGAGSYPWRTGSLGPVHSLAVLPLENLSGDPTQDYFADGMTDELITDLARLSIVRVISRTSVMQYKGTRKPVPQIARELNVDGIVEGSVMRFGERVRIRIQLIYAPRDQHIWASTYERDLKGVLELQADAARDIASEMKLQLTGPPPASSSKMRAVSPEVHELYLRGRYFWNKRDEPNLRKAAVYFQQAIALDPDYADAYAGLSDTYILLFAYAPTPPENALLQAKAAAEKAVQLDDSLAEAHTSLAILAPYDGWNWEEARRQYERALELNPNYATAHHWYGDAYLAEMGKTNEAVEEIRKAQVLDPLSPIIATDLGKGLIFARRYDDARVQLNKALELDSNYQLAHYWLWYVDTESGRFEEASGEIDKAKSFLGTTRYIAESAFQQARSGNVARARQMLAQVLEKSRHEYVNPSAMASVYASLGEKDQAFFWLEKGYAEKLPFLGSVKIVPSLDPLRSDPRFSDLVRRVGLPP